jgi:hypothetical protein
MKSLISVTVVLLLLSAAGSPAKAGSDMPAVTSENKNPQERGATPSPLHDDRHGVRQSRTTALKRVTDGMHTPRKPQLALAAFKVAPPPEYRPMETQRYKKAEDTSGLVPMLVGEKNPAIALQSETNNGSAAYAGITQIELELTGTPA